LHLPQRFSGFVKEGSDFLQVVHMGVSDVGFDESIAVTNLRLENGLVVLYQLLFLLLLLSP
jgi:hypothetical protein